MTKPLSAAPTSGARSDVEELPLAKLRQAVAELFAPNPAIYWTDFLASIAVFYAGFAATALLSLANPLKYVAAIAAVLALYRAGAFIHELVHLPPGGVPGFRAVWNLTCGIPLLMPDFVYGTHRDHHVRIAYGTTQDGEYHPWALAGSRPAIVLFVMLSFVAPPAAVVRFAAIAPLCLLSPRFREWAVLNASSLVIHVRFRRVPPAPGETRRWRPLEAGAFFYCLAAGAALYLGVIPWTLVLILYLMVSCTLVLNAIRTLAAHRYRSAGAPLTMTGQLLDSIDYPGPSWGAVLWAPVGLRYHATHHLLPGIPYHNLAAAHRRIAAMEPPGSPYHRAVGVGLRDSLRTLWRAAR